MNGNGASDAPRPSAACSEGDFVFRSDLDDERENVSALDAHDRVGEMRLDLALVVRICGADVGIANHRSAPSDPLNLEQRSVQVHRGNVADSSRSFTCAA